jgi:hypothetical protein
MRGGLAETLAMVELGTRCTTERVHVGNSLPKVERAVFLPDGSGRQGLNLAGESPVILIARFECVAIPQFVKGNLTSIAWCKRPGRPGDVDLQRWVQPGGLASMGA